MEKPVNSIETNIALAIAGAYDTPGNRLTGESLILFIVSIVLLTRRRARNPKLGVLSLKLPFDMLRYSDRAALLRDTLRDLHSTAMSLGVKLDYGFLISQFEEEVFRYEDRTENPAPSYETARFIAQALVGEIRLALANDVSEHSHLSCQIDEELRDAAFKLGLEFPDRDYRDHQKLRLLLAQRSGIPLYTDDGELVTTCRPHVDFIRFTPTRIRNAFIAHNQRERDAAKEDSNGVSHQG